LCVDIPTLDAIPAEVLGHSRYACDNDMVCGWAGSLGGVDGINVVSGTGTIPYGERLGQGVRVGVTSSATRALRTGSPSRG
jgi:N-acetylglucosamine kinase-like BadF-type ATPase